MTSRHAVNSLILMLLIALGVWIAFHTHWEYVPDRTPLRGEALTNRFYTLEHVVRTAGGRSQKITSLRSLPPTRDVLYVESFTDEFGHSRLEDLKKWVKSGGRLVVPSYLLDSNSEFAQWAGLRNRAKNDPPPIEKKTPFNFMQDDDRDCYPLDITTQGSTETATLSVCAVRGGGLFPVRAPQWAGANENLIQVLRMPVGRGSVTALPWMLLGNRQLLRHDHALLFYSATGLNPGERLSILDHARVESFPALLWRLAAPALLFLGCACALLIWRQLPRFGPMAPAPDPVRRSLAEQIRANAAFSARTGKLGALRAAVRRALDQTAAMRIAGYETLDVRRRVEVLAARAGVDARTLNAAMTEDATGGMQVQRSAIALLEYTRRILKQQARLPRNQ